jgi:tRNA-splicing ligase RtcB
MKIFKNEGYHVPVFSWCDDIEESAQMQIDNVARLPFVANHIAILPDCHAGYGVPIGTALACDGVVIPFAVGADIGCGLLAIKTNLTELPIDGVKKLMGNIRERIPVGRNWHKTPISSFNGSCEDLPIVKSQVDKAQLQLGTLGSNNHFCEIQMDSDGYIWFMIHSGSRNLGKQIADYYDKAAKDLNAKWFSSVPKEWNLAFLPMSDPSAQLYMKEMQYAVDFAQQNRDVMAEQIKEAFAEVLGSLYFEPPINIAHNYAAWENIKGKNVLVHRKGATSARDGQLGIIPGSQGSASYIVKGLGNVKSFYSCSHGAGRKMGRNQAKANLDLAAEIKRLDELGVVHGIRSVADLDEAAGAYKDIDIVMANQQDLVEIVTKLTPMGVVKG